MTTISTFLLYAFAFNALLGRVSAFWSDGLSREKISPLQFAVFMSATLVSALLAGLLHGLCRALGLSPLFPFAYCLAVLLVWILCIRVSLRFAKRYEFTHMPLLAWAAFALVLAILPPSGTFDAFMKALASAAGYLVALWLLSGVHERTSNRARGSRMRGLPEYLLSCSLMAFALAGFDYVVGGK